MTQKLNWGEIWLADLNPRIGTESGKTRPVLIIQNQVLLDVEHPSTLIVPLTTNLIDGAAPLRLRVAAHEKLRADSDLLIDQMRAIDNKRLVDGPIGKCSDELMRNVHLAVLEVIGFGS
jgi:mRNA interferase MazF